MYEQTNTMMETKTLFQIPQLLDGDAFTSEDLADDMEGLRLSFTRIKIPGGGHLQFEIPSGNPDVPDYAPYLEGVILYSHNSNAYWPEGSEYDDDQPPLCQSFDGKVGYDALAYSAPSRNGAGRLRKMEKRAADAVRSKIRIMI